MPERMCVICKKRDEKGNFYRFSSDIENKFFYDKEQKFQSRGFYLCKDLGCLNALSKHKKIKIEVEELMKNKRGGIVAIEKHIADSEAFFVKLFI